MPRQIDLTVEIKAEELDRMKRIASAAVIMTTALGRIAEEDFNHPVHASNIARKALREVREVLHNG